MDKLIRGVTNQGKVRFLIASTKELVETARKHHQTTPVVSAALGRLLTATAIMGSMLKQEEKITIRINGDGPIGTLMSEGTSDGKVRGFAANKDVDLPLNSKNKLDVGRAVGKNGTLTVIKDLGIKSDFSSQLQLVSGEIGDDLSYYFYASEQIPSIVGLGVLVDVDHSILASGGYIIQLLPGYSEDDFNFINELANKYNSITNLVKTHTVEEIAKMMFNDDVIFTTSAIEFYCPCSKQRFISVLATIDKSDILEMIEEDHGCTIRCEYCSKEHELNEEDLKASLAMKENSNRLNS